MTMPPCTKPKRNENRCGKCKACVEVREAIYALFDSANADEKAEAARELGVPWDDVAKKYRGSWRARQRERGLLIAPRTFRKRDGTVDERDEPVDRPRCRCGLSIDKDHGPDNCDLYGREAGQGLGGQAGFTW